MSKSVRFVGLDVHAETIAVAVAEGRGEVRSLGIVANRPEAVRRLLGKLGKVEAFEGSKSTIKRNGSRDSTEQSIEPSARHRSSCARSSTRCKRYAALPRRRP
jgi:hypothetical protein